MTKPRKICVITGTRAEFGLLTPLMREISRTPGLALQVIATGAHLSPEFGLTYKEIESEGFRIDEKVEMLLSSDTPIAITKSMGLATIGFADAYVRLDPDIIVLLGDRYEILAAAQAALIAKIPVAHIAGGDLTEGAYDDAIRHSITKMSHVHFVTHEDSARIVRQLGEDPHHIHTVGSLGIDNIRGLSLLSRAELEKQLDFKFRKRNLLVTYHPVTLGEGSSRDQMTELLGAIESLGPDVGVVFTKANSDTDGRIINQMTEEFASRHPNAKVYASLGQLRYLSLIAQVDAVVGNSSSGLLEVPSFKKPTVNIGDRQKGRLAASSVLNCGTREAEISAAIQKAFGLDCSGVVNPYGDGQSASRIVTTLKTLPNPCALLKKRFHVAV